jgi:glutathione S-transferase
MITLYGFGPAFGLPDPSPFVMKAEVFLKMAGLPYTAETGSMRKAPKGKLPYIVDDGEAVADSTFIRFHLEKKYHVDFDRGLTPEQRAVAWAFEKMLDDHFYWAVVKDRWLDNANFAKGPRRFFRGLPAPIQPIVAAIVRRKIRQRLHGQGMGRHSAEEITALATRSIVATSDFLGSKPYMMGDAPTGLDATVFAFVAATLCPVFESPIRLVAERHDNLKSYVGRMMARFYPDLDKRTGHQTAA